MPVSQKAATVVASKIPGGNEAVRHEIISDALFDTTYDIRTPEQGAEQILQGLREKR